MRALDQLVQGISYVAVATDDVSGARRLFGDALEFQIDGPEDDARYDFSFRVGHTHVRVMDLALPECGLGRRGWNHIAVQVASVAEARQRLAEEGIELVTPDGALDETDVWCDPGASAGVPIRLVETPSPTSEWRSSDEQATAPEHDYILEVDHLGVASRDAREARRFYSALLGFSVESTQVDSEFLIPVETTSNDRHGVKSRAGAPIPAIGSGLMAVFIETGHFELEIMQPLSESEVRTPLGSIPGSVGQDQGAISRFLERRGEGLLHMAFKTPDIRKALERVRANGIGLIDDEPRPGGRGSEIAFMDRTSTNGMLMHFVQPESS